MVLTASLVKTSLFLIPTLSVNFNMAPFYVKQVSSAECSPQGLTRWHPKTATWIVESGYHLGGVTLFVGHKSYHSIDSLKKLDSYDYAGVSFQKEFK